MVSYKFVYSMIEDQHVRHIFLLIVDNTSYLSIPQSFSVSNIGPKISL